MGGRGASAGGRYGGGGLNDSDILDRTSLVSAREGNTKMVDDVLGVCRNVYDDYGMQLDDLHLATIKSSASAMAYYDGANVGFNKSYFNQKKLESAYANSVKTGFHPKNGNKTAAEAVAAHELGHALTGKAGNKMGGLSIHAAATRIVNEARMQTKHKGVVQMSSRISKYATHSNAEAVAEAFADVYCNGKKAKAESIAIINTLNKYAK